MNSLLEDQKTETLSDERVQTKESVHNSQINDNYRKYFGDGNPSSASENRSEKREGVKYATLEDYKILESKITFEEAQRAEEVAKRVQAERMQMERMQAESSISAAKDAANSKVLTSPEYSMAARRKEREAHPGAFDSFEKEEEAKQTVRQAARAAEKSIAAAQKATAVSSSAEREYYLNLAKKALVIFAVAFVLLMTVIAVNSAVLNGMNIELTNLEQTLQSWQMQVEELRNAIAEETDWESILEFIEKSGMIFVGS